LKVWARPLVTISLLAAACTTSAPASQGPSPSVSRATTPGTSASPSPLEQVNVAFVRDNSVPDADEHALPALQGAQLAFQTGALADPDAAFIRLALVDVGEDPSALEAVAADPSFVAVIVAPGVGVDVPEGVPVVSLSGLVPASDAGARLVPPTATTARTLARTVRNGPCILSEDPPPDPLGALVATRSGEHAHTIDVDEVSAAVSERGCGTVVWTGGPDGAADVAVALEGTDVRLVGGDRLLDFDFLAEAGASGEGARAFCPCADVSTSTAFAARRFIQDYQSEFGSAPAAYSVEGWDAGHLVRRAVGDGAPTREEVGAWLRGVAAHRGLAGTYRFGTDGEVLDPGGTVRVYRVVGGRWLSAPA
jgi:hypothetical protein